MSLDRYLQLLDWVGRAIRCDKRGSIPVELDSILSRIGLTDKSLLSGTLAFRRSTWRLLAGRCRRIIQRWQSTGSGYLLILAANPVTLTHNQDKPRQDSALTE